MKLSSEQCKFLFGVLFLTSCVNAVLTIGVGPGPLELDAGHYWSVAGDIARGDWLQLEDPTDCRTPIYPAVLGVYRAVCGRHALLAVVVSQHVLVMLVDLLAAYIAWRVSGGSRLAAVLCYGLSVFSLMRPWFANLVCPETLFMFLLLAAFAVLCAYHQRPGLPKSVAFGTLLGLAILVRPVPKLLWIPLLGLFCLHGTSWVGPKRAPRAIWTHAVAAIVVLSLVVSPWMARNWKLFGRPFVARLPAVNKWEVCFQGGSAARLEIPNSPSGRRLRELLGTRGGDVAERHCATVVATLQRKGVGNEEIDRLISQACREAIVAQPGTFAWQTIKRFVNYWRCTPNGIPYYEFPHRPQFCGQREWDFGKLASLQRLLLRHSPAHWLRWNECWTALSCAGTLLLIFRFQTRLIGISLACIFLYFAAVTSAVEIENYKYRVFLEPLMVIATVCGCLGNRDRKSSTNPKARRPELEDTVPYGIPIQRLARPERIPQTRARELSLENDPHSLDTTPFDEEPIVQAARSDQASDLAESLPKN